MGSRTNGFQTWDLFVLGSICRKVMNNTQAYLWMKLSFGGNKNRRVMNNFEVCINSCRITAGGQ